MSSSESQDSSDVGPLCSSTSDISKEKKSRPKTTKVKNTTFRLTGFKNDTEEEESPPKKKQKTYLDIGNDNFKFGQNNFTKSILKKEKSSVGTKKEVHFADKNGGKLVQIRLIENCFDKNRPSVGPLFKYGSEKYNCKNEKNAENDSWKPNAYSTLEIKKFCDKLQKEENLREAVSLQTFVPRNRANIVEPLEPPEELNNVLHYYTGVKEAKNIPLEFIPPNLAPLLSFPKTSILSSLSSFDYQNPLSSNGNTVNAKDNKDQTQNVFVLNENSAFVPDLNIFGFDDRKIRKMECSHEFEKSRHHQSSKSPRSRYSSSSKKEDSYQGFDNKNEKDYGRERRNYCCRSASPNKNSRVSKIKHSKRKDKHHGRARHHRRHHHRHHHRQRKYDEYGDRGRYRHHPSRSPPTRSPSYDFEEEEEDTYHRRRRSPDRNVSRSHSRDQY